MNPRSTNPRRCVQGLASVVVLLVLFAVAALLAGNAHVLRNLRQELRRVERVQLLKYQAPVTNSAPARIVPR